MPDLPEGVRSRRAIEDRLADLGAERSRILLEDGRNLEAIVDTIPDATAVGLSFEAIANLVGVSRQTLYRWQGMLAKLRDG